MYMYIYIYICICMTMSISFIPTIMSSSISMIIREAYRGFVETLFDCAAAFLAVWV